MEIWWRYKANTHSRLFNNVLYTDAKIYIGTFELSVHRLVLAAQSEYFNRAFKGNFLEAVTKEIRFESGGHAHWRVFEYMYTGKYSLTTASFLNMKGMHTWLPHYFSNWLLGDDIEVLKHLWVYELVNMFLMEGLKNLALLQFKSQLYKLHTDGELISCIQEVYEPANHINQRMKYAVVEIVWENLRNLSEKVKFLNLVRENGNFAADLVVQVSEYMKNINFTKQFEFYDWD
jgi:hypothetical protein